MTADNAYWRGLIFKSCVECMTDVASAQVERASRHLSTPLVPSFTGERDRTVLAKTGVEIQEQATFNSGQINFFREAF